MDWVSIGVIVFLAIVNRLQNKVITMNDKTIRSYKRLYGQVNTLNAQIGELNTDMLVTLHRVIENNSTLVTELEVADAKIRFLETKEKEHGEHRQA